LRRGQVLCPIRCVLSAGECLHLRLLVAEWRLASSRRRGCAPVAS
jgi:hypothetical protein